MSREKLRQKHWRALVFTAICSLVCLIFLEFFRALITPLALGAFFTFLLLPVVDYLEVRLKLTRTAVVGIILVLFIGFLVVLGVILFPIVKLEIITIAFKIPQAKEHVLESWMPALRESFAFLGSDNVTRVEIAIREFSVFKSLRDPAALVSQIFSRASGVLGGVINGALVPVVCFFLLKDMPAIRVGIRACIPDDLLPGVRTLRDEVAKTLQIVFERQLLVSLILGVLYIIGLSVVGLNASLAIGAIAGVCRLVPYMDVVAGLLLSFVVIVTDPAQMGWSIPAGVVAVFIVVQLLDGMVITPRVIGESVGLHAGIVIASVIAFGHWLGFGGVLIAIPALAVMKILLRMGLTIYWESKFFQNH